MIKIQQTNDLKTNRLVCGDSVYITLWLEPITTIVIENETIAKEYLDLYEILWNHLWEMEYFD